MLGYFIYLPIYERSSIQGFEISRQTKHIADANRQIFVLSIAAKFCIFAFLLEYLLWIIELQIFARIVLFVSCYGAVGTFAVVVNFFTIYKIQQANAGMYC